jgi:hypothetical protein
MRKAFEIEIDEFLVNCAMNSIERKGKEFPPMIRKISFLWHLVGDDKIKSHYGDKFKTIENKFRICRSYVSIIVNKFRICRSYVSIIVSYFSHIDKKIEKAEDLNSKRFIKYQEALGHIFFYYFDMCGLFMYLLHTAMKNKLIKETISIESKHWTYVTSKVKGEDIDLSMHKFHEDSKTDYDDYVQTNEDEY